MNKSRLFGAVSACAIISGLSTNVSAALLERLGGLAYYDDVADLTWLADANALAGTIYDDGATTTDGYTSWQNAMDWAANLTVAGVGGWRLANTVDVGNDGATYSNLYQGVDFGYNITTPNELSNLFYNVLGNTAFFDTNGVETGCSGPSICLTNSGPFINIQARGYWQATEYAPNTNDVWGFNMGYGSQLSYHKTDKFVAWAVQSGDVSAVPVPAAMWLFGSGLLGLVGIARGKKAAT